MKVHVVIQHVSNGVDGWDRLVAVMSDETMAGCCAIDLDERLGTSSETGFGNDRSFSVESFDLLHAYDINALAAVLDN